ncbi:hypothetical protein ACLKA6_011045 [Drosophila palustris]
MRVFDTKENHLDLSDQPTLIIDPIDGTKNFVHGFHYNCISVGFWLNKQPELAICLNPLLDMEFTARRNCGAYLNKAPIRASGQTDLERALVINEMNPANFEPQLMAIQIGNAEKMLNKVHTMRTTGSATMDLCLVAMDAAVFSWCGRQAEWSSIQLAENSISWADGCWPQLGCQMVELLGDLQIYHPRDDEPSKYKTNI